MNRVALLVAAALLLTTLAVPVASADHIFSHRFVVTGRVIGSDGVPVASAPVNVTFEGIDVGGACFDSKRALTDERGDFRVCRHVHAAGEARILVNVTVQGESFEAVFDKLLRKTAFHIVLDAPAATRDIGGTRMFERTLRVEGRVFVAGDSTIENVPVNGTPIAGREVAIMLLDAQDREVVGGNATTSEDGDYRLDLDVVDIPPGARVQVTTSAGVGSQILDARVRRADVDVVRDPPTLPTAAVERPGTGNVGVPASPLSALFVAVGLLALARRRFA